MACQRLFIGFSIGSFYYFAATTVGRNSRNNGCAASALRRHHHDRLDVGAIRRCGMRRAASLRLAARSAGIVVFFIATRSSATSKHAHKDVTHAVQYPSFRRAAEAEAACGAEAEATSGAEIVWMEYLAQVHLGVASTSA